MILLIILIIIIIIIVTIIIVQFIMYNRNAQITDHYSGDVAAIVDYEFDGIKVVTIL